MDSGLRGPSDGAFYGGRRLPAPERFLFQHGSGYDCAALDHLQGGIGPRGGAAVTPAEGLTNAPLNVMTTALRNPCCTSRENNAAAADMTSGSVFVIASDGLWNPTSGAGIDRFNGYPGHCSSKFTTDRKMTSIGTIRRSRARCHLLYIVITITMFRAVQEGLSCVRATVVGLPIQSKIIYSTEIYFEIIHSRIAIII